MYNDTSKMERLREIRALLIDLDGVVWRDKEVLPGGRELFEFLDSHGLDYRVITNNSTRTPQQVAEKLGSIGVDAPPQKIINSAIVTVEYLKEALGQGGRVYVFGEEALEDVLEEAGFVVTPDGAEAVVVSMNRNITYDTLAKASTLIRAGAKFVATNDDKTFPAGDGLLLPGGGTMVAAVATAAEKPPDAVLGKPNPAPYELAMRQVGASARATAVIGDRLETDILGGLKIGVLTVLVMSGITDDEILAASDIVPDLVFPGLPEFVETWGRYV